MGAGIRVLDIEVGGWETGAGRLDTGIEVLDTGTGVVVCICAKVKIVNRKIASRKSYG